VEFEALKETPKMNAVAKIAAADLASLDRRVENYDWDAVGSDLDAFGSAVLEKLLTANECDRLASLYANDEHFRSHVNMARHGFGKGEYKYFKYPLPIVITELRTGLYSRIVTFANAWNERMNIGVRYPKTHADYLKACHDAGQVRTTIYVMALAEFVPVAATLSVSFSTTPDKSAEMPLA
jgi:uncharacterized protein